jgi:hypothetical protein
MNISSKVFSRFVWLLGLISLFFIGDRLAGSALQQHLLKSEFRYSRLYQNETRNDILILGNSRGVNGFYQPDIEKATGQHVLNLSYNALPSGMATALLEDYLERHPAPRLLLVEVSFFADPEPLNSTTLANFKPYSDPSSRFFCRLSHLYCFNSEMHLRALYYLNKSDQNWINRYTISQEIIDSIEAVEPFELELNEAQLATMQELLKVARQHSVAVKLVMSPYFPAYTERIQNLPDWLNKLEQATGLDILDYSKAVTDTNGFSDRLHLNPEGSLALLKQMLNDGVFN